MLSERNELHASSLWFNNLRLGEDGIFGSHQVLCKLGGVTLVSTAFLHFAVTNAMFFFWVDPLFDQLNMWEARLAKVGGHPPENDLLHPYVEFGTPMTGFPKLLVRADSQQGMHMVTAYNLFIWTPLCCSFAQGLGTFRRVPCTGFSQHP